MAVVPDTTSHATAVVNAGTTLTWAHTCGASANKLIILPAVGIDGVLQYSSVTYNTVPATQLISQGNGTFCTQEIWSLDNPDTGSAFNIVATVTGSPGTTKRAAAAISFSGVTSEGTAVGNSGVTANPSVTVTDSANGDYVVSSLLSDIGSLGSTTEAGTIIFEDEDFVDGDLDYNSQYQVATGANAVASWTSGADGWAAAAVAIKGASADVLAQSLMPQICL